MDITGIDHFVLTVEDVDASCRFYQKLGGEIVTFGNDRTAIHFGEQKINLHPTDADADPVAAEPTVGGGDFCLLTETPTEEVVRQLDERDVELVEGPIDRTGANGSITSVYTRDPDGNLVEIGTVDDR